MSGRDKDSSGDTMWLLFGSMAIVIIIGIVWGRELMTLYMTLNLYKIKFVSLFYPISRWGELVKIIEETPIYQWRVRDAMTVAQQVGLYINIPFAIYFGHRAYKVWDKNPNKKYVRKMEMDTFLNSEKGLWPYNNSIIGLDLIKVPLAEGVHAMTMRPLEYVQKYKLLQSEVDLMSLDKVKTEKLLATQLGNLWVSAEKLKVYERALFGIFAAQALKHKEAAANAVKQIAASAGPGKKLTFDLAFELFEKYKDDPYVQGVAERHAYVFTVLSTLLSNGRENGVLPPSHFRWLKAVDRRLFLMLNCVGRQTPFIEVCGIYGHWKAEIVAKHKIEKPFVDLAIKGIEEALKEVKLPNT